MSELSSSDLTILRMLQDNAREKLENIACETGLSVATVQRRIRSLRDKEIVQRETAVVQPEAVGYTMTFLVLVEMERERIDQVDAFRRRAQADPQVQQCYYITGEADFALLVLSKGMEDFERLTHRLFFEDANIKRFRTSVVMKRCKFSLDVPMALATAAEDA